MTLRILFAIHGPRDARTAVYLTTARRAEFLTRQGHSVDIVTPADLPLGGWARLQPLVLPPSLAARGFGRYDVVVLHSHLAWAHALRRRPGRRPAMVVAFHGLEPIYHAAVAAELARSGERLSPQFDLLHRRIVPRLLRLACRSADRVFCLNSAERAYLVQHQWATADRVVVTPNGVEQALFTDGRVHRQHARRLLFTGQWLRAKGTRYLAAVFGAIAERYADAELTCIGTGADASVVLRDFPQAARPRVRVLPTVGRDELAHELLHADLFLFPSLSEGFSGALIEAMAAGLPVVATSVGAAGDLLEDGRNAIVVSPADPGALLAGACVIMDDAERRRSMAAAARETAAAYEWDRVNERFAEEILRAAAPASR
jgi:glycosyltransferase involved in cell wall biosynthesis